MSRQQKTRARNKRNQKKQAAKPCQAIGCTRTTTSPMGYCFQHFDMAKYNDTKRQAYLEKEAGLPITLQFNHRALGMDENTVCEACQRGDHANCNLATWCQCEDDCDGQPDCYEGDPYSDLP